jgi:uncharacterized glyoxalase superfamily protein PhnB
MKIVPYLFFAGNARKQSIFIQTLDGKITRIQRYGESPAPIDEDWKQKVMHSELILGTIH